MRSGKVGGATSQLKVVLPVCRPSVAVTVTALVTSDSPTGAGVPLMTPEVGSMLRPCGRPEALYVIKRTSSPITAWRRRLVEEVEGGLGFLRLADFGGALGQVLQHRPRLRRADPLQHPNGADDPEHVGVGDDPLVRRLQQRPDAGVHLGGVGLLQRLAEGGFGLGAEGGQLLGGGLAAVEVVGVQVGDEAHQFGGRNPWNGSQSLAQPFRCGFGGLRQDLHGLIGLLGVIGRQVRPEMRKVAAFERVRGSIRCGAFQGEASNGAFPLFRC